MAAGEDRRLKTRAASCQNLKMSPFLRSASRLWHTRCWLSGRCFRCCGCWRCGKIEVLVSGSKPIQQAKTAHGIRSSDFARLYIITLAVSVGDVESSTGQRSDGLFYWCVMNYYAFHIGDYKAHTQHLTPMEDLIYRRMLDLYYLNESPLPDAQKIARSICLRDHISDIETILSEFFVDTPDGFIHPRCEREIKAMNEKSGKAKASAQARWKKSSDANAMRNGCERNANASKNNANASNSDANAMRNGCERNAPNTQYPIPNTKKKEEENARMFSDSDSRRFFTMPMDWSPDHDELQKYVNGKIHAGKPLTLEQVMEHLPDYREATHAKGERRTESEWCRALVKWAQRCLLNPKPEEKPKAPAPVKKTEYWQPDPKRMMTPEELAALEAGRALLR